MRAIRVISTLLGVALISACGVHSDEARKGDEMTTFERLDELGFLTYANAGTESQVRSEIEGDASSGVFSLDSNRFFFADAEDLAEGGVSAVLDDMRPTLERMGVPPLTVQDDFTEDHYTATINGADYPIWKSDESNDELLWGYAAARTVMALNDLLARAGSSERAYGYLVSNDFGIFLLTPQLREVVAEAIGDRQQSPYTMTDDPPSFGFPE